MTERIEYLKKQLHKITEDKEAYCRIEEESYLGVRDKEEIFRKSSLLMEFAKNIPIVFDERELIVGSMRFWRWIKSYNMGHIIVDFEMVLSEGIPGIKEKLSKLDTPDSEAFREAFCAFEIFVKRCAEATGERYLSTGNEDMKRVSDVCKSLLENKPRTFHEALQLVWFVQMFLHVEGMASAVSFGRFDEYLYPFYERDLANGVSRDALKEIISCFWIKVSEGANSQNLTLGGGEENDLTLVCLEVCEELKIRMPSVSVRINEKTTERVWRSVISLIKAKIGMPAIFNDEVIISSLKRCGISEKDAENYAIVGCYEPNPSGRTYGTTACAGLIRLHDILLEFLNSDIDYSDFDALYCAFKSFFKRKYETDILDDFRKSWERIQRDFVSPFQGVCFRDCLENGLAAEHGGCKYTMFGINILGIGTLIDSLYCIKKLVFEEKRYSYAHFVAQVRDNFPNEEIALRAKNYKGKYGTDSTETNKLAEDLSVFIADLVDNGKIAEGVIPYAGLFLFFGDIFSKDYPATPDGRHAGERISYGISASDICADKTITSVLNSATHIANDRFADGNPIMLMIDEKQVDGEKGDETLRALISSYFKKGGYHLQFNIADKETLKRAQEHPEEFSDLLVRVSGYCAYFTKIGNQLQNALIERL